MVVSRLLIGIKESAYLVGSALQIHLPALASESALESQEEAAGTFLTVVCRLQGKALT